MRGGEPKKRKMSCPFKIDNKLCEFRIIRMMADSVLANNPNYYFTYEECVGEKICPIMKK